MWSCSPWALLPPVYSVFTAAGLWLVYFIALRDEMIAPLGSKYWRINGSFIPPYISIAGNSPPSSCIFSEVMNLSAFVGFVIAVLRYLQLRDRVDKPWLNVVSLVAFSIGSFGMTILGNFQFIHEKMIHNIGTLLAFTLGLGFCWVQSYFTLRVNMKNEGRTVGIIRFLLSGFITVCMILELLLKVQKHHAQAAPCQWALVMLFLVFFGTFAIEFRHSRFHVLCTDNSGRPVSQSETSPEAVGELLSPGVRV